MKNIFLLITFLFVFVLCSIFSYVHTVSNNISSSVIRLHVIANSNSQIDQNLKYAVRDDLLDYMNQINASSVSRDSSIQTVLSHIDNFKTISKDSINSNGFNYNVIVEFGNYYFPTKQYSNTFFPAGHYDALKVTIGEGKGENWWCVMFPPLCIVDNSSAELPEDSLEYLNESLSDDEIDLINKENTPSEFKFKLIEIFNKYFSN